MLYLIATPIGNLEDITLRALRILKEVDLIAAEDTRHSKKLLSHYEIDTQLTSYHSHTTDKKLTYLVEELKSGKDIAVISDAGTPGISDPAWTIVSAALEAEIEIVPIPGPSAFLTALSASGLPMNKFLYLGFVPAKKGRQTLFKSLIDQPQTTILYESPHRILKTITQMHEILGPDRKIVVARELTKMYETFHRGTLEQILEQFTANPPRGEMVILVSPS